MRPRHRVLAASLVLALAGPRVHADGRTDAAPSLDAQVADLVARTTAVLRAAELRSRELERDLAAQRRSFAEALATLLAEPRYVPIAAIQPGQSRFSQRNVDDKVEAAIAAKAAHRDERGGTTTRAFDGGRAILPLEAALPVVVGPAGIVLVDGHHDVLSSLALGATTVPVKLVATMTDLPVDEFWRDADAKGLVYAHAVGGAWQVPPRGFDQLVDDPLRYLAAIAARKCATADQPLARSTGARDPLWVKVGKDVPFIEFKIADALVQGRFAAPANPADPAALTPELLDDARRALREHPVPGLRVVPARLDPLPDDLCNTAPSP